MTAPPGVTAPPDVVGRLAPDGPARPAPGPRIVAALAAHELRLTARRGESLLVTFAIPLAVLAFFASVDVLDVGEGQPVDALLPGTLALAIVASGLVSLGIATAFERAYGVLKRLAGSPASSGQVVAAKVVAVLVIEIVQALVLVGFAWLAFDWRPGPEASLPLVLVGLVLGTIASAGLGLALAGMLRAEAVLAAANAVFLAFLLLGGVVVPLDRLPDAVQPAAALLPIAALADVLRVGVGTEGVAVAERLAVLAAWAVVGGGLAAWRFRVD